MMTVIADGLGYDAMGNAPHLLAPVDAARLEQGDFTRVDGEALCKCGAQYRLHPDVQGALWLTRGCDRLVKL